MLARTPDKHAAPATCANRGRGPRVAAAARRPGPASGLETPLVTPWLVWARCPPLRAAVRPASSTQTHAVTRRQAPQAVAGSGVCRCGRRAAAR
eukprot:SAG22_NODE_2339_length_2690_cov_2.159012_4_plen_94_part_00